MGSSVDDNFENLDVVLKQLKEEHRLTAINRLYLKEILNFLKIFKEISIEMEKSLSPTLYLVWPSSVRLLKFLAPTRIDSVLLKKIKKIARVYYKKNFTLDKLHRIASFLHPQMKTLKFASDGEKLQTIRDVKEMIQTVDVDVTPDLTRRRRSNDSVISVFFDDDSDIDEVELYVAYKVNCVVEIDLLQWWSEHRETFPKLYKIAMFIQTIPATSAPSER